MLTKLKQQRSEGFTIIEVMIVLAIAGLIILIVLLAVPALNRSSRNTSIKNDASAITAAISDFRSNNDGQMPDTVAVTGSDFKLTSTAVPSTTEASGKVSAGTVVTTGTAPGSDTGTIQVVFGKKCSSPTSFTLTDSKRSAAILYNIETSSSVAPRCVDA